MTTTLHTIATTPYNNDDYKGTVDIKDKITCLHCGKKYHQLAVHLKGHSTNIEEYLIAFPDAPTVSAYSSSRISAAQSKSGNTKPKANTATTTTPVTTSSAETAARVAPEPKVLDLAGKVLHGRPVADVLSIGLMNIPVYGDLGDEQAYVPRVDANYDADFQAVQLILAGILGYENTYIYGPTGSGKTAIVKAVCSLLNRPFQRINLNGDTQVADLIGDISVVTDEKTGNAITVHKDGPLVDAMKTGKILLIDEIDAAHPAVLFILQRLLEREEDPESLVAAGLAHCELVVDGKVIKAHPDFRIIATGNTNGSGDMTGDYAGTNILNKAFMNRFAIQIEIGYPEKDKWMKILRSKTRVSSLDAKWIVETAINVNIGKDQGFCNTLLSPRNTLAWARLCPILGFELAARSVVLNSVGKLHPDYQFICDILKNVTAIDFNV